MGGGEPAALAIQTTYGLRARMMRIFPRFSEGSTIRTDPGEFPVPPRFTDCFPNYCRLEFSPLTGIDVFAEFWVPGSQVIAGRIRMDNNSIVERAFRLELAALLTTLGDGHSMAPQSMQVSTVLQGQTGGLAPVLFLTGGPETGRGPYPSLAIDLHLPAGTFRQLTWALASLADPQESLDLARRTTARSWEAEVTRIQFQDRRDRVAIECGDPGWDAAFSLSQKIAARLFQSSTGSLPFPSFTQTRLPDQGYSGRGDGSDYNHLWSGQTALDAWYLGLLLLPGNPELAKGLVRNFLAVQKENGEIDWKPGLAGQRGRVLAQPLLATLAWRIFQASEDRAFLEQVFLPLVYYLTAWFRPERDRDRDGFPEWEHAFQSGFDENPLFDRWHPGSQGVDIQMVESPSLGAFLVRECHSMVRIAQAIHREEEVARLVDMADWLAAAVQFTWDGDRAIFHYRDRDTHQSRPGETVYSGAGPVSHKLDRSFAEPQRLVLRIRTRSESTRPVEVKLTGQTATGEKTEVFSYRNFAWIHGKASVTTQDGYLSLNELVVRGLDPQDEVELQTVDFNLADLTLLLPLWAGIPKADQAQQIVEKTLLPPGGFGSDRGFRMVQGVLGQPANPALNSTQGVWNAMMVESLLAYGYREQAAEILSRLVNTAARSLAEEGSFFRGYAADTGQGTGERDHLEGLPPVGLFLEVLGVRIVSAQKIILSENNPFPWPVTVKYRGLKIFRETSQTLVTFPGGQTATVTGPGTHQVYLTKDSENPQAQEEEKDDSREPRSG